MKIEKREPTKKQLLFFKYWKETGFSGTKGTECAKKAGYSLKNAAQMAYALKRNPTIRTAMQEALHNEGLTLPAMAKETTRLALHSKHPFAPDMPDNEVRRRTLEMAGKMHDVFPSHKIDIRKTTARYNMTEQDVKRFDDYKEEEILDAEIIEEEGIESF